MASNGNNSEPDPDAVTPRPASEPASASEQPGQPGQPVQLNCSIESVLGKFHSEMRAKIKGAKTWAIAGERTFYDFKQFTGFPEDIRFKIWTIVAAEEKPRIITIYDEDWYLRANSVTPRVMHACSQSRKAALVSYTRIDIGPDDVCFIDFVKDWVFFDTSVVTPAVFGDNPQFPIFQEKCSMLAVQYIPFHSYGATVFRKFAKLKQLAIVNTNPPSGYEPHGGAPEKYITRFTKTPGDSWSSAFNVERTKTALEELAKQIRVPRYGIVDVVIERLPAIMNPSDKTRARKRREDERKLVAPVRADELLAFKMQWEMDMRKVKVKVEETLKVDDDEGKDEFGFPWALDHGVFKDDFMMFEAE